MRTIKNKRGIEFAKCCLTCKYMRYTTARDENGIAMIMVNCARLLRNMSRTDCCSKYQTKEWIEAIGDNADGRIKRKSFLMHYNSIRSDELKREIPDEECLPQEEIERTWQKVHGNMYMDDAQIDRLCRVACQYRRVRKEEEEVRRRIAMLELKKKAKAAETKSIEERIAAHPDVVL